LIFFFPLNILEFSFFFDSSNFFFFFFGGIGIWTPGFTLAKQVLCGLGHNSSPFWTGYFGSGVSQTICLGCPQTLILPISASEKREINYSHFTQYLLFLFSIWLL
jgi:hypothetical protein